MDNITDKQERFAQLVADRVDHNTAYKKAFAAKDVKQFIIDAKVSDLIANPLITARVAEIHVERVGTANERMKALPGATRKWFGEPV